MKPENLAVLCARLADDKKARDVEILDIRPNTIADYFVIISAESDVQVKAVADGIIRETRKKGIKIFGHVEGYDQAEWILIDFGDVIVHVFYHMARLFYDLDGFWGDAPKVEWSERPALKND